jgi:hypothetical protein
MLAGVSDGMQEYTVVDAFWKVILAKNIGCSEEQKDNGPAPMQGIARCRKLP